MENGKVTSKKNKKKVKYNDDSENVSDISKNTPQKNVSWADSSPKENKKTYRSTPYPKLAKKVKITSSTPVALEFDNNDSDNENFLINLTSTPTKFKRGVKRKRNNSDMISKWTITACDSQIKADTKNAAGPFELSKNDGLNENVSSTYYKESSLKYPDCDFVITDCTKQNDDYEILHESLNDESDDESINASLIDLIKPVKIDKKLCRIIEPPLGFSVKNIVSCKSKNDPIAEFTEDICYENPEVNLSGSFSEKRKVKKRRTSEGDNTGNGDNLRKWSEVKTGAFISENDKKKRQKSKEILQKSKDLSKSKNVKEMEQEKGSKRAQNFKNSGGGNKTNDEENSCNDFSGEENKFGCSKRSESQKQTSHIINTNEDNFNGISSGKENASDFLNVIENVSLDIDEQNKNLEKNNRNNLEETPNDNAEYFSEPDSDEEKFSTSKQSRENSDRFSCLRNFIKYFIGPAHCIVILKHPVSLNFCGKLSFKVLSGAVEILGHILTVGNEESEIYSPKGTALLSLTTVSSQNQNCLEENFFEALKNYGMSDNDITSFSANIQKDDCVFAAKNLQNNLVRYLKKYVPERLFPEVSRLNSNRVLHELEMKLESSFFTRANKLTLYKKNENWLQVEECMMKDLAEKRCKTMICGGKGVGKSTLCRFLINSLLNQVQKVVFIDLDPGQAEFSIAGCVGVTFVERPIFGPSFTHLQAPEKSFFFGDSNVLNNPDNYITCVQKLLAYCEENISKNYPWIVNFMGFTQSLGADLTIACIKTVAPTLLIQIMSKFNSANYEGLLDTTFVKNFKMSLPFEAPENFLNYSVLSVKSSAESEVPGAWIPTGKSLRDISVFAYLSQILTDELDIVAVPPYAVNLSSVKLLHVDCPKGNTLPLILNGNLVALCEAAEEELKNKYPGPSCVGFGVVRGIDIDTNTLYLLTPVPEEKLDRVNCLMMGNVPIPESFYVKSRYQGLIPFVTLGTAKGGTVIPRRTYLSVKSMLKKSGDSF